MSNVIVMKHEEYQPIFWDKQIGNNLYAYNKERKIHSIKVKNTIPDVPTGVIEYKTSRMKKPVEMEMHSWTRNYYNRLICPIFSTSGIVLGSTGGAGYLNSRDISGSWITTADLQQEGYSTNAEGITSNLFGSAVDVNNRGIIIGSGDSAFSFENYAITPFTNGVGSANYIKHLVNTIWTVGVSSGTWTVSHGRFFDNFSGGDVVIKEIGIICYAGSNGRLEERTVLPSPVTLANREAYYLKYIRTFSIPSSTDWTRNFYNAFMSTASVCNLPSSSFGDGYRSLKDTGGTVRYGNYVVVINGAGSTSGGSILGVADNSSYGIQFGTGDAALSVEDYALETIISHSAAFDYEAGSILSTYYTAGTKKYTRIISRIANNISSGDVSISELGLTPLMLVGGSAVERYFLSSRKLIGSPITVSNGESVQAIWEIESMALPA